MKSIMELKKLNPKSKMSRKLPRRSHQQERKQMWESLKLEVVQVIRPVTLGVRPRKLIKNLKSHKSQKSLKLKINQRIHLRKCWRLIFILKAWIMNWMTCLMTTFLTNKTKSLNKIQDKQDRNNNKIQTVDNPKSSKTITRSHNKVRLCILPQSINIEMRSLDFFTSCTKTSN